VRHPERDVYALSRTAETGLRTAGRLDQAVSLDYPPSTLVSLQRGLQTATTGYLEAAMAINTWMGEPTVVNEVKVYHFHRSKSVPP
jgi:hypothetical protein